MNAEIDKDGVLSLKTKKDETKKDETKKDEGPVLWISTEFDRNPEKCFRLLIICFSRWKKIMSEKNILGKCHQIREILKFKSVNGAFQIWRRNQVCTALNRATAKEIGAKDELIQSLQSQLRKVVGDLHEFESRSDSTTMYVAERALNR
jgi:hypothetical protein